jgi:transporter family-2 protein
MTSPTPQGPTRSRTAIVLAVFFSVVCGAGVATQSRINGELGSRLGDGFVAAVISFGSGLVILLIVLLFAPTGRRGLVRVGVALRQRSIPWWYVGGGSAGAFLVLSQGLVAATLGVALFTVGIVAGQTLCGLLIDRRGLGTAAAKPLTVPRLAGSALALVAVGIAVSTQLEGSVPVWMLVLPFLVGIGTAWQQAVNGQVRHVADSAITATLVNFIVGTAALLVVFAVSAIFIGFPTRFPTEPWLYLGGAIGVLFIAGFAVLVRTIGVLVMGLASIAGQLLMSLVLDIVAPVAGQSIAVTTIVGTVLTLVAVGVTALPSSRARSRDVTATK